MCECRVLRVAGCNWQQAWKAQDMRVASWNMLGICLPHGLGHWNHWNKVGTSLDQVGTSLEHTGKALDMLGMGL